MTTLRLRLDLLRRAPEGTLTAAGTRLVTRTIAAAERLYELAQSLVDLVSVDTGGAGLQIKPFDLAAVAAGVVDAIEPEARDKGLAVRLDAADGMPPLHSDEHLVRLILVNLVGNAVKFTERGEVSVSVTSEPGAHRVVVRDTGPGISEGSRSRIFEPFGHLEPLSHKHTRGAGVGLAIVRRAVDALGGRLELESHGSEGATFIVVIPSQPSAPH